MSELAPGRVRVQVGLGDDGAGREARSQDLEADRVDDGIREQPSRDDGKAVT